MKCSLICYSTGSDRNNIVETGNSLDNYPLPFEMSKMFQGATAVWSSLELKDPKPEDIAVSLASAGMAVYSFFKLAVLYNICPFSYGMSCGRVGYKRKP